MNLKDTLFSVKQTINCSGRIIDFAQPRVMGILNVTTDSFYDGGKYLNEESILCRAEQIISEGADIIDIGGFSSRPGANEISSEIEKSRLKMTLNVVRKKYPNVLISVDTYRSEIAEYVVNEFGVNLINDISAGLIDREMLRKVGKLGVPYIMMHMKGIPVTMQNNPVYNDVIRELLSFFAERISLANDSGIIDIIIDPGFGFGKSVKDNYLLLKELNLFKLIGMPVLVGLSRKSMIYKALNINADEALNGTSVLNTIAINNGANILRVHDVKEAVQIVTLMHLYGNAGS